jgi:hypothetical protein
MKRRPWPRRCSGVFTCRVRGAVCRFGSEAAGCLPVSCRGRLQSAPRPTRREHEGGVGLEPPPNHATARRPLVTASHWRRDGRIWDGFRPEFCSGAVEIEDVGAERVLAAEVRPLLVAAEQGPQRLLRLRHGPPQGLCALLGEDRGSHRGLLARAPRNCSPGLCAGPPPPPCFAWSPSPVNGRGLPTANLSVGEPLPRSGGGGPAQPVEGAAAWPKALEATGFMRHALPLAPITCWRRMC